MEEDHKAQIAELEARAPGTPQEDKEARVEAFRLISAQMKSRIDDAQSVLADAMNTWSELDEHPERVELQQSIQQIENATAAMKEEIKSLGALAKMRKMTEMNRLQQEEQRLRAKEIQINNLLQPYHEQIIELEVVEQKVREFTTTRNEIDATEDSSISQLMLESAQDLSKLWRKKSQDFGRNL